MKATILLNQLQFKPLLAALIILANLANVSFAGSAEAAEITFPETGSSLIDTRQLFTWEPSGYDEFWIYLGSSIGGRDIYNSGSLGLADNKTIYALPHDGRTMFLRLFFRRTNEEWEYSDYTYQAHNGTSAVTLVSPNPGSTLIDTVQTFNWRGDGINEWWIYVGSTLGGNDIHNSGNLGPATTSLVAALPHDRRTIFIRLFYRQTGAAWRYQDYTYV